MNEGTRSGLDYLREVTALLQRVRAAHPTMSIYEAADFQWWWRKPVSTHDHPQLFWFDDAERPAAAVIATDWGDTIGLDPIPLPEATPEWVAHVVERGLAHAEEAGFTNVDFVIDPQDHVMADVLAVHGFTKMEDELVDAWLAVEDRPPISILDPAYRLATRLATIPAPHHMTARSGPDVEERLNQTPLYRADHDLVVLDDAGEPAAYGMFWHDPVSSTGLVEPMRTEDEHQGRGLARHILTVGINKIFDAGAARVKISWDPANAPANKLYTDVGFKDPRRCVVVSRPEATTRRY